MNNSKEKEAGAEGKTEDPEGEGEPGGEDSRGDAGTESAGQLGQLGLGPPENRIEGDSTGEESQRRLEQEAGRQVKRRGGANPMGTMPPGWKPPQGPLKAPPQPREHHPRETRTWRRRRTQQKKSGPERTRETT